MIINTSEKTQELPSIKLPVRHIETTLWLSLLILCNYSLFGGKVAEHLIFLPNKVTAGEWYRVFLSPFTHVSRYHLALDASAFLMLWNDLHDTGFLKRTTYFVGCFVGSLIVPLVFSDEIYARGLCGLSGIAHGLFAIVALRLIYTDTDSKMRKVGVGLLIGLLTKVMLEIFSTGTIMTSLHIGDVGVPITTSHLGGIAGGIMAFFMAKLFNRHK